MMTNKDQPKWAYVHWNEKFICIETYSGLGRCVCDPDGANYLLSPAIDDCALGKSVADALFYSRKIPLEDIGVFFDIKRNQQRYENWVSDLMSRYEYKTRRELFKSMLSCGARQKDGIITFSPSRHDLLEGWGRTKRDIAGGMIDEVIPDNAAAGELGAALRRAMSRCR